MTENSSPVNFVNRQKLLDQKFYFTTAINYLNGRPHVGHAYEIVLADSITRYHRIAGRDTFLLTGSDEHGQKVAAAAATEHLTEQQFCDKTVLFFKELNVKLTTAADQYIRTTDPEHILSAQAAWVRAQAAGDIYKGEYVGYYNVREETFVTQREAEANNFKDPVSGAPLTSCKEESYFFRLSKYHDAVLRLCRDTEFILPASRRQLIVSRLQREPLEDLSISRCSFKWGVPVPGDDNHVMYVWFDALSNYLTATRWNLETDSRKHYWPAEYHIIGHDISWFHAVIWPAMLMSIDQPLPQHILIHGMILAADGTKMSKSLGNVVDPNEGIEQFGAETLRYYFTKESRIGPDWRFSVPSLIDMHNADLADVLGNLVHRGVALCIKNCNGVVPDVEPHRVVARVENRTDSVNTDNAVDSKADSKGSLSSEFPVNFEKLFDEVEELAGTSRLSEMLEVIMNSVKDVNKYLTVEQPWAIKDDPTKKSAIIRTVIESLYVLAHYLHPFLPNSAEEISRRLGTPLTKIVSLESSLKNLKPGTPVTTGDILFKKFEKEEAPKIAPPKKTDKQQQHKQQSKKQPVESKST